MYLLVYIYQFFLFFLFFLDWYCPYSFTETLTNILEEIGATVSDPTTSVSAFVLDTIANVWDLYYKYNYTTLTQALINAANTNDNQGLADMLQLILTTAIPEGKDLYVGAIQIAWNFAAAAYAAKDQSIPQFSNGGSPNVNGCLFFADVSIWYSMIENVHFTDKNSTSFTKEQFDKIINNVFNTLAEQGRGCGSAYIAASEKRLFGGLSFPGKVFAAFYDFGVGFNTNLLLNLIQVSINYSREMIGMFGDVNNVFKVFEKPW